MNKRNKILQLIINTANQTLPDSEVYLFGSQARGNANNLSDWDLLILLNKPDISFENENKILDEFYELEVKTGEIISPIIYTKTDWNSKYQATPLFENIQKEGIRLK